MPTFLQHLQVFLVVVAVLPAWDAQDLQVEAGGQRHSLLMYQGLLKVELCR